MVRVDPAEGPQPGPFRPERLAAVLNEHDVDYVVVGGIAAIRHGSRRATLDLDIVPEPTRANTVHLAAALEAVDAHPRSLDIGLTTDLGILNVLQSLVGVTYDHLRARSEPARLGDQEIRVVGVDDLIAMKLRAGRPIDLQDIAAITGHEVRDAPSS
jgi:hypothetical protein